MKERKKNKKFVPRVVGECRKCGNRYEIQTRSGVRVSSGSLHKMQKIQSPNLRERLFGFGVK